MGDGASKLYLKNILSSLSSSFTEVKNAISGVSTKVDSLGADSQELKDSMALVKEQTSGIFRFGKNGRVGTQTINVSSGTTAQILNVSGKGRLLFAVLICGDTSGLTLTLGVDGKNYSTSTSGYSASGNRIWQGYLMPEYIDLLERMTGYEVYIHAQGFVGLFGGPTNNYLIFSEPLEFDSILSLKLNNTNQRYCQVLYAYELSE